MILSSIPCLLSHVDEGYLIQGQTIMSSTSPPPSLNKNINDAKSSNGGWIGIDLGTTNCTASVWDISRSRCKVLRLGYESLARPPPNGGSKGGKIVPSAVLFRSSNDINGGNHHEQHVKGLSPSLVGYAAIQEASKNDERNKYDCQHNNKGTLVTSFKRVVGITSKQAIELDLDFWNSLPFQPVILDATTNDVDNGSKQSNNGDNAYDVLGGLDSGNVQSSTRSQTTKNDMKEGIAIRIQSNEQSEAQLVTPLQVTTILLQSIRNAASDYLIHNNKSKIQTPGLGEEDTTSQGINNCIIGVPAHYSQSQRSAIQNAAKNAGFVGTVGIMTESTAATMAYGLFVSPTVVPRASSMMDTTNDDNNDCIPSSSTKDTIITSKEKNILVFDMGGGTTDCTIANLDFGNNDDKVQFRVVATSGDSHLGGDDVDELVAKYIWKQHMKSSSSTASDTIWKASEHNELISACRCAKEELCGNDDEKDSGDNTGMSETQITVQSETIQITRQEFDSAIQQLIDRAERVLDNALSVLNANDKNAMIHEVVLVGGSTHIPTIRSMLRRKFPPPIPPELCTSISAETAVAQGLAIQAALLSGVVPLYEMKNAMMLDVMPHAIGVWVHTGNDELSIPYTKGQIIDPNNDEHQQKGHFMEILQKDTPLPAMGCATFTLANINQTGVTVVAVEHIGPGDLYQCMGVFDFLLCRLNDESKDAKVRNVKIGMTLETSGKFVVSIYDELDPDHRDKLRTYLKKKIDENNDGGISDEYMKQFYEEEDQHRTASCSGTEMALAIFCIVFFALYVAARVAFSDLEIPNEKADEL